ncbi:hypothetical protein GCM10010401_04460 [Rarobacter faecitabidus]|uniref:Uncharacterized protein DUF348 n=1 Tax=Rarobacter faecitabidus TaxID=13243 RepID=A0A542ZTW2_RARFA|nr:G5 domain-containing protein [Rarobacter faecitabidus]TQL63798.1 uncharacterized protein DUF348 [Rarobacter faecitabidus]
MSVRSPLRRQVTQWVARSTVVAVLAAGTVGFAASHKRITVDHNGAMVTVTTFGSTVGDALAAAGITPADSEIVAPSADEKISDGDQVTVRTPQDESDLMLRGGAASRSEDPVRGPLINVTVTIDGAAKQVATQATTVRSLLRDLEVTLGDSDAVIPGLDTALAEGAAVTVAEAATSSTTVVEDVDFKTTTKDDPSLEKGEKVVETKGEKGTRTTTYSVVTVAGEEISRQQIASAVTKAPVNKIVRVGSKSAASDIDVPTSSPITPGSARAIAKEMVLDRGWDEDEFACLDALWQRESGWRVTAHNKGSGAYGIPQALPGSKMGSAGSDWRTSAETQIKWGLGYIKGRYKTPCGAWSFFKARNFY